MRKFTLFCLLISLASFVGSAHCAKAAKHEVSDTSVAIDIVMMIEDNDAESLRHEFEMGLNPNSCLDDLSLLMIAAQLGRTEIVRDLLAQEAIDMHAQDNFGNTALHFAVIFGHTEVVKLLLYADEPRMYQENKRSVRRFVHQIANNEGKIPADLAHSEHLQRMLRKPNAYISSHPQEFREIVRWFDTMCPIKARARSYRHASWSDKISSAAKKVQAAVVSAARKTSNAIKNAYGKAREVAAKSYEGSQKTKEKVDSKMQKAKAFCSQRYETAKGYAATGLEKTKNVASAGYQKTKTALKGAYQKVKAKIAPARD